MTTGQKQSSIHIVDERCKGCNFCVEFCPQHILYQSDETNAKGYQLVRVTEPDKCTGCELCSRVCPEFSIYIEDTSRRETGPKQVSSSAR